MPTCKECKFYKTYEDESGKGDCFGHEVEGEMDSHNCPEQSFQSKDFEE